MSRRRLPFAVRLCRLFLPLLVAAPLLAQAPPPEDAFAERVDVRLVEVALLATDRDGRPVTDLTADEIVVEEDGRAQEVAVFTPAAPAATPTVSVPDARLLFAAPDGNAAVPGAGAEPRWLVFFFDLVHGDLATRDEARRAAAGFVDSELQPGDRVAVVSFSGAVHLDQGFTADRAELRSAIERAFAHPAPAVDASLRMRELLSVLRSCQKQMVVQERFRPGQECVAGAARAYVEEVRPVTERFVAAFDGVARLLAGVDGRKYLFLFSHGVSLDAGWEAVEAVEAVAGSNEQIRDLRYELTHGREGDPRRDFAAAIERAIAAEVTVFGLDGAAVPAEDFGVEERVRLRRTARPFAVAWEQARASVEELARSTGGKLFGSGDFAADLAAALAAARGAYTVGYYRDLASVADPDAFFKVKVESTRPGVRIAARRGYYLGVLPRAVPLARLELGAAESRDGVARVPFSVVVDPLAFALERGEREVALQLTLHLALRTSEGAAVADSFHFLAHAFPRAAWDAGTAVAPRYDGVLELAPGEYQLRALVRDPRRDGVCELQRTLTVRADP